MQIKNMEKRKKGEKSRKKAEHERV